MNDTLYEIVNDNGDKIVKFKSNGRDVLRSVFTQKDLYMDFTKLELVDFWLNGYFLKKIKTANEIKRDKLVQDSVWVCDVKCIALSYEEPSTVECNKGDVVTIHHFDSNDVYFCINDAQCICSMPIYQFIALFSVIV